MAQGINGAVRIAGLYHDAGGTSHGFVVNHGVYTTVDVPGARWTEIDSINAQGQVVGACQDAAGAIHGFVGTPAH
jgi:hypothetical protein